MLVAATMGCFGELARHFGKGHFGDKMRIVVHVISYFLIYTVIVETLEKFRTKVSKIFLQKVKCPTYARHILGKDE